MANLFKIDLQEDEWVDQVFQGRNQAYGAYKLRKQYSKTAVLSGIIAVVGLVVALGAPVLLNNLHFKQDTKLITEVNELKAPSRDRERDVAPHRVLGSRRRRRGGDLEASDRPLSGLWCISAREI